MQIDICVNQLKRYVEKILDFNQSVNVVSKTINRDDLWLKHVLDSLLPLKYFLEILNNKQENKNQIRSILDIGSGGGFPGIVLAISLPNIHFYLIESKKKKCNFLKAIVKELSLNVTVKQNNIYEMKDNYFSDNHFIITSRAFSQIDKILKMTRKLYKHKKATFILYKGMKNVIQKEIETLPQDYQKIIDILPVEFPSFIKNKIDIERHIIRMNSQNLITSF